ncbi:AraC family transcriptional regulator [Flaviaesturariibacter aridisoli]|uniref:AraC family transcriptional regulator n=1 Tax=Flaviaesturariibacter aridisoli TaxID=2545761 RepID=A0A4R4DV07_9BACT|nr:AraC family transcriptional regulator [Flaviaesturariibacter aridisoli]TCZ67068.1 AraC family transcriptional regulator [Flaviaesturariibacter aridisoli]
MRAAFEEISSKKGNASFVAYDLKVPAFPFKWHYHPEYELTLITRGSGKRLVGDSYEPFAAGDLVLIGPNLPHTWTSDRPLRGGSTAVVIQFSESFAGDFLHWPEAAGVAALLEGSAAGLHFPARASRALAELVTALPARTGMARVTALLEILGGLSRLRSMPLASAWFDAARGSKETERRINKVCQHIQKASARPLPLAEAAALLHLSPSAFCRFFKRVTGKTFSDYLNDVRTGHACSLLTGTDKSIAEIAFATGFESLTYFNRVFRKKKGLSPREYRARMQELGKEG